MWGYGARHDGLSTGVLDPLYAAAVVIQAGTNKLAIVGLDLGRAPAEKSLQAIRQRIKAEAGIDYSFIAGSHTHHGPVLELTDEALAAFGDHSRSSPDLAKAPREVEGSRSTGNLFLAAVAAFVGQKEAALQALSASLPSPGLPAQLGVIWSPVFKPLRNEPRFLELVRAMKMPDYWRAAGWGDFCRAKGGDDFECIGP